MQEEFYEALADLYSPGEILEKLNIDFDTFLIYFEDYIEDNAKQFEDMLPEYFEGE